MSEKLKISSNPKDLTVNELQSLARKLKIDEWQEKSRKEIIRAIGEIAEYDPKKEQIENILDVAPAGIGSLGHLWYILFQKSKFWTSSITIIVAIAGLVSSFYFDTNKLINEKNKEIENLELTNQIKNLKTVESELENLIDFVKHQQTTLSQTETEIESLIEEKKQIEPIVKANREVIQAIFQQQAENSKKDAMKERAIGFGLGVLGSILASIIIYLFTRKRIKSEEKNDS
tara:strand:+ start:191 stop:883 length:693 start_codon:yes stop_codon:yes gene_type:complete